MNVNLTEAMHNPDADDRFNYLGHGDAFHVGDFNPGIPGPEVFLTAEQPADFKSIGPDGDKGLGYRPSAAVYDPRTGEVLVGMYSLAGDLERGVAANIDPNQPGAEYWTNGFVWSAVTGERLLRECRRALRVCRTTSWSTGTATCSVSCSTAHRLEGEHRLRDLADGRGRHEPARRGGGVRHRRRRPEQPDRLGGSLRRLARGGRVARVGTSVLRDRRPRLSRPSTGSGRSCTIRSTD